MPQGSRNSRGQPIVNMFPLQDGEKITVVLPLSEVPQLPGRSLCLHGHRDGHGEEDARCPTSRNPRKAGIIAVDLDEGDYLIGAALTDGKHDVMLFSDGGKAVRFDENDVRPMGRNARGVRGMMLDEGQQVIAMLVAEDEQQIGADRHRERLRQAHADRRIHPARPRHQGHDRDPASERNGKVVAATLVRRRRRNHADHDRRRADPHPRRRIREMGRATQGVTLIALDDGTQKLSGICERDRRDSERRSPARTSESAGGARGPSDHE